MGQEKNRDRISQHQREENAGMKREGVRSVGTGCWHGKGKCEVTENREGIMH
jgi:hypothetical protein